MQTTKLTIAEDVHAQSDQCHWCGVPLTSDDYKADKVITDWMGHRLHQDCFDARDRADQTALDYVSPDEAAELHGYDPDEDERDDEDDEEDDE